MNPSRKLNSAIKAKNLVRVKKLLKDGARPDSSSCIFAIENRQHEILKLLIKNGADLSALEPYWNRTPLGKALKVRNLEAAKILLDGGASPNESHVSWPALIYAARDGLDAAVQLLLKAGAEVDQRDSAGNTPLMWAATFGHEGVAKLLLESGANPVAVDLAGRTAYDKAVEAREEVVATMLSGFGSAESPETNRLEMLTNAIRIGDDAAFSKLVKSPGLNLDSRDKFGWRPLDRAIERDSAEFVRALIHAGADINALDPDGSSPLDVALRCGRVGMAQFLIKAGARPNAENPLYQASLTGNAEFLKFLIDSGYDPRAKNHVSAACLLVLAAQARSLKCVNLLLKAGVNPNDHDERGWTALFAAVAASASASITITTETGSKTIRTVEPSQPSTRNDLEEIVAALIRKGADVNARDRDDRTALTYADTVEVAKRLLKSGARLDIQDKRGKAPVYWLERNGVPCDALSGSAKLGHIRRSERGAHLLRKRKRST